MQDAASCYRMGMTEFAPNAIDIKKTSAQACEPANRKTKQNKQTTTKKKKGRKNLDWYALSFQSLRRLMFLHI